MAIKAHEEAHGHGHPKEAAGGRGGGGGHGHPQPVDKQASSKSTRKPHGPPTKELPKSQSRDLSKHSNKAFSNGASAKRSAGHANSINRKSNMSVNTAKEPGLNLKLPIQRADSNQSGILVSQGSKANVNTHSEVNSPPGKSANSRRGSAPSQRMLQSPSRGASHGGMERSSAMTNEASPRKPKMPTDKEQLYSMPPSKARNDMIVQLYLQGKCDHAHDDEIKEDAEKQFQKISKQKKGTRFYLTKNERENILEKLDDIWMLKEKQEKYLERHQKRNEHKRQKTLQDQDLEYFYKSKQKQSRNKIK